MYCIIDIETTGLSKNYNHITEIAAVKFDGNKIVGKWESLINPWVSIPRNIVNITGIDDEMVRHSPSVQEVLPEFIEFMGDDIFVAHNISFDHWFIQEDLSKRYDYRMHNQKLCTKKLANRIAHHLPSKSLGNLCQHYGITNTTAHRAMSDVLATVEVLKKFIDVTDQLMFSDSLDLFTIQSKPVPRCRKAFV